MPAIFPPEIIENCVETYYSRINTKSKIIYGIFLLLILTIFILLPLVYIQISIPCRGVIRTTIENTVIQSATYAEVMQYHMAENRAVSAGETLLVLNTEKIDEQIILENRKREENLLYCQDITCLLRQPPNQLSTPKYRSEYNRYSAKINEQQVAIKYLKKEYETASNLLSKNAISEFEYLQQKNSYEKASEQLESLKNDYLTSWQSELTNLQLENQILESNIKQLEKEKRLYIITAPVSGNLVQVAGIGIGNFIAPNQPLAYISTADSLLVETYVSPTDIGYIQKHQRVKFQIDAFDYRQWGLIEGYVSDILSDVVMIENKPMFRVRCQLDKNCLELKNGYKGCIQKGLTLTTQFQLNKRSLWQLLFDKVDNWINPKIIKQ